MTLTGTDGKGNALSSDYKVTRYGIKIDAKGERVQTLAAGNYTLKEFYNSTGIPGGVFRINGLYLLHMGPVTTPMGNNGCISVWGRVTMWKAFLSDISTFSGSSNYNSVAKAGLINMNITTTTTPSLPRIR